MITENSLRVLLEGWQDLTNKQYDDASKGIGRIDRNGDYHAKREVTAKVLKKQKASDRIKAEADLAINAFKNVEASVIKSANSVYAGKNNVAKIEADPDAKKSYSSRVETNYSGRGFRVDPMYLYVLVTDTNGNKAHIKVDSRPSLSKDVHVEKEDGCSISDEYLNKIGNSIVNFMHSKIRSRYENSKRYENDIREKIARHHRNSSYPNGYAKGAEHELRRREYLGEDVLEEGNVIVSKRFVNNEYLNKFDIKTDQMSGVMTVTTKTGKQYKITGHQDKIGTVYKMNGKEYDSVNDALSVITEGSHHAKYSPAINYKYVNNYLIKARKAIKEGNVEEAEKWAWEAQEAMHEDEMQGPGVAAYKNVYNIFHKQLSNIHSAILAAKKANKESN